MIFTISCIVVITLGILFLCIPEWKQALIDVVTDFFNWK